MLRSVNVRPVAGGGGGGGITDGNKGDITVSAAGSDWQINAGAVGTTELGGDITTSGKELLTAADDAAQRATLGLGTMATEAAADYVTETEATSALNTKLTRTESGGAALALGAIPDGTYVRRSGTNLIGDEAASVGEFAFASLPAAASNAGRWAVVTDLNNAVVRSDGSRWRPLGGRQSIFRAVASPTPEAGLVVSGATTETDFSGSVFVLPAGLLSTTGGIDVNATAQYSTAPTGATLGTVRFRFGADALFSPGPSATINYNPRLHIRNRNSATAQFSTGGMTLVSGGSASFLTGTVNTASAVTLKMSASPGTDAPTATLYFVEYYWVD